MASRVNTKLLLVIVGVLVLAAGGVGALFAYQIRNDVGRIIAEGDAAADEGDYSRAVTQYGRAANKEPGNREALEKLEENLLKIQPTSAEDALDRYRLLIGTLRHWVEYFPHESRSHFRLIEELYLAALISPETESWKLVAEAADLMEMRLPPDDPDRVWARLYRGTAQLRRAAELMDDEAAEAEADILAFVSAKPEEDMGWASLIQGRLGALLRLQAEGSDHDVARMWESLDEAVRQADTAMPDGPKTAKAKFLYIAMCARNNRLNYTVDDIHAQADRMHELTPTLDDAWFMLEIAELQRTMGGQQGVDRAIEVVTNYLEEQPNSPIHRYFLANCMYEADRLDEAEAECQSILAAAPLTVSYIASAQHEFKRRTHGTLVDCAYRRWFMADAEDPAKADLFGALEGARDALRDIVVDRESDPLLLRADGKVAFAAADYATAAIKFDQLLQLAGSVDVQTVSFAARAIELNGDVGAASRIIETALRRTPTHATLLYERARLAYEMRNNEVAQATLEEFLNLHEPNPQVTQLQSLINARTGADIDSITDPVIRALRKAEISAQGGDIDAARSHMEEALGSHPDDLRLIVALVKLELSQGENGDALEYINHGLAIDPANRQLLRYASLLKNEDPIGSVIDYVISTIDDPVEQQVTIAFNLDEMVRQRDEFARQAEEAGDAETAAEHRAIRDQAREASAEAANTARATNADHPALVELSFRQALRDEQWDDASLLVDRARELDLDNVGGKLYQGRLDVVRGNYDEAVRSLQEVVSVMRYSATGWSSLAFAYERVGNVTSARDAYEQAYACDPTDMQTVRRYLALLGQLDDRSRARGIAAEATRRSPRDLDMRELWLALEAEVGSKGEALTVRKAILETSPTDRRNKIGLARLLVSLEASRELILDENGEQIYVAGRWSRMRADERSGVLKQTESGWFAEAAQLLDEMVAVSGENLDLMVIRARLLEREGRGDEGAQRLRAFIDAQTEGKGDMLISLARFQVTRNQMVEAVETLREAVELQDEEMNADRELAQLFYGRSMNEQALVHLERLKDNVDDQQVELMHIEVLSRLQRYAEAGPLLDAYEGKYGEDYQTVLLRAGNLDGEYEALALAGHDEQARNAKAARDDALTKAMELNASSATPYLMEAQYLVREFTRVGLETLLSDALGSLTRADEIQPNIAQTSFLRAQILQEQGDGRGAVGELRRLVDRAPRDARARNRLVHALLRIDNPEAATDVVREAAEANPTVAGGWITLGELYLSHTQEYAKAAEAFNRALNLDVVSTTIVKLAEAMVMESNQRALEAVRMMERYPAYLERDLQLGSQYVRALTMTGRREDAQAAHETQYQRHRERVEAGTAHPGEIGGWFIGLRTLFPRDPMLAENYVMRLCDDAPDVFEMRWLSRAWITLGEDGASRAAELSAEAVKLADNPLLHAELLAELGTFQMQAMDHISAVTTFEELLKLDPNNALAHNNIAYIRCEHMDDPQGALPSAERAWRLLPAEPAILDTYGWVHYRLGNLEPAEEYLRRAVARQEKPDHLLHLAHVLAARGDRVQALQRLERAEELEPDEATRNQIINLADDIRNR